MIPADPITTVRGTWDWWGVGWGDGAVGREKSSRTNRMNSVSSCPNDGADEGVCGGGRGECRERTIRQ